MILKVTWGDRELTGDQMAILRAWSKSLFGNNDAEYHEASPEVAVDSIDDDEPVETVGIDMDGDGQDDVMVNIVQARPGATWTDEQRMLREGMRRSLAFAQMSRFRVDMTHQEYVSSLGVVTRLELGTYLLVRGVGPGPERELGRLPPLAGGGAADSPAPVGVRRGVEGVHGHQGDTQPDHGEEEAEREGHVREDGGGGGLDGEGDAGRSAGCGRDLGGGELRGSGRGSAGAAERLTRAWFSRPVFIPAPAPVAGVFVCPVVSSASLKKDFRGMARSGRGSALSGKNSLLGGSQRGRAYLIRRGNF